jgi:hypothetical protein
VSESKRDDVVLLIVFLLLVIGLPLLGARLAGRPASQYMQFPPLTGLASHAAFSWPVFAVLSGVALFLLLAFDIHVLRSQRSIRAAPSKVRPFPWWGSVGVMLGVVFWVLAWTRLPWFSRFQRYTFTPLWLSYILVVNALGYRRTGHCMLIDRPRFFLLLFPVSAMFWWFFEYLNRFVQNWYYEGAEGMSGLEYFLSATLPFSTVLPAVLGTYDLLASSPRAGAGLDRFVRIRLGRPRAAGVAGLCLSGFGLAGVGLWPSFFFPLLWVSPVLILVSLQAIRGRRTVLSPIAAGDWRRLYLLGMSALCCGFFWEMWNGYSLARWVYSIPFVHRFKIFEMPLLGYMGYLPFGVECAVIGDMLAARTRDA